MGLISGASLFMGQYVDELRETSSVTGYARATFPLRGEGYPFPGFAVVTFSGR